MLKNYLLSKKIEATIPKQISNTPNKNSNTLNSTVNVFFKSNTKEEIVNPIIIK